MEAVDLSALQAAEGIQFKSLIFWFCDLRVMFCIKDGTQQHFHSCKLHFLSISDGKKKQFFLEKQHLIIYLVVFNHRNNVTREGIVSVAFK